MTTNQILTGAGLIFALAVGSQVLASRLRIPAIIVLLPVGFVAGALTPDVDPQRLLGPGLDQQREQIGRAGLELAPGELLAAATGRGARLEGITAVLLLTDAPYTSGEILFADNMTRPAVSERYTGGARILTHGAGGAWPAGADLLFVVRADGQLVAVTQTGTPAPQPGDTWVSLGPALASPPADPGRSELPEVERR